MLQVLHAFQSIFLPCCVNNNVKQPMISGFAGGSRWYNNEPFNFYVYFFAGYKIDSSPVCTTVNTSMEFSFTLPLSLLKLEQFSIEYRKTNTKVIITSTNHNRCKHRNEPIQIRNNSM